MLLSLRAAAAMLDALTAQLDSGAQAGYIEVRSGTKPMAVEDSARDGEVLAVVILNDPAFGLSIYEPESLWAEVDAIVEPVLTDSKAGGTGTATWFRAYDSNDHPILDGTVGTVHADLVVNAAYVEAGQPFTVTSLKLRMPTGK